MHTYANIYTYIYIRVYMYVRICIERLDGWTDERVQAVPGRVRCGAAEPHIHRPPRQLENPGAL